MRERILMVGIGQCGGNIVNEFFKMNKNYSTMAINTSNVDLSTINASLKYHIPTAQGCAKDINKAVRYAKDYYNDICNVVEDNFASQDIIFVVFGMGGGTGAGLSPILLDILSHKYPHKNYGAICVLPSFNESLQTKQNTIETYEKIIKLQRIKNVYFLDNDNRKDKFEINGEFVNLFDRMIDITKADHRGIIDKYELEKLFTCQGNAVIHEYKDDSNDVQNLIRPIENSIFSEYEKGCKYIGISMKYEFDTNALCKEFGKPLDMFLGYNDKSNMAIFTGMPYPTKCIEKFMVNIIDWEPERDEGKIIDINFERFKTNRKKENEVIEFNIDDIFEKYK
jgi:hypothetical protein